jgi:hypothetical protein
MGALIIDFLGVGVLPPRMYLISAVIARIICYNIPAANSTLSVGLYQRVPDISSVGLHIRTAPDTL